MMKYLSIVILLLTHAAFAEDPPEIHEDLIHSDLPLWGQEAEEAVWPKNFYDDETFGCIHNIALGDWRWHSNDPWQGDVEEDEDDDLEEWYRFGNYGVFHCYLMIQSGYKEELDLPPNHTSFLVKLGDTVRDGKPLALWALQMGGRPGSDYILLASKPTNELIDTFDKLQVDCPKKNVRETKPLDILLTRYCAINSRQEMIALAQAMAKLPPAGTMQFVQETPEGDSE